MVEIKNSYEVYKDSGVEWLGQIPEHWELTRLGSYFIERRTKVSDKDYAPLSVTKNGILPQLENAAKSNDGDNRKLVKKGDFVINSRSDRKGSSGIANENGSVSLINIVMKPLNINPVFCNYLLKSTAFVEENYRIGHGIVADLWTTRYDEMKNIKIGIPTPAEQTTIANFLDDKTRKIDQAIAIKEQQIALLKERKQIIIQEAVTKGLDKNIKLKDSGVEWIGEIPEHWEVKRFRNIFNLSKGLTITKENLQDEGIYCVNYGEIHSKFGFEVNPEIHELKCVSEDYLANNQKSIINKGDFVFADTSEDIEGSGNFTYLNYEGLVFAGYHTIIAKPFKDINSRFFAYKFDSIQFRNQVRTKMKGVKVYSITQSILKELYCWIPSTKEQDNIVEYLDNQSSKIDQSIAIKEQEIEKLKEYKMSLIDAVVTGKVKVF
jgi:type I restriction enzyme, S subunit